MDDQLTVATLVVKQSLPSSNVDCSVAKALPGKARTDGAILEIGTISSSTVNAFINQAVKKSGRTTGLTRSRVSGLNATVSVAYDNECAGGAAFTKTFTDQIVISNKGSRFLNSGDSGSLMVEDIAANPRAVGLLFAGAAAPQLQIQLDRSSRWPLGGCDDGGKLAPSFVQRRPHPPCSYARWVSLSSA